MGMNDTPSSERLHIGFFGRRNAGKSSVVNAVTNQNMSLVSGLLLGARNILLAFVLACILGSVIHSIRMKVSKKNNLLAMGPYLSAGIFIAALWGNRFWTWYLGMMGIY